MCYSGEFGQLRDAIEVTIFIILLFPLTSTNIFLCGINAHKNWGQEAWTMINQLEDLG